MTPYIAGDDVPPLHDLAGKIWIDGNIVAGSEANVHVLGHSSQYGETIFEGIRIYNGNPFLVEDHIERLFAGMAAYQYPYIPFTLAQISQACVAVAAANGLTEGYIRPIAYLGSEDILVAGSRCKVHIAIAAVPLASVLDGDQALMLATQRRASARCMLVHTKSAAMFAAGRLAKLEALRRNFTDALFLDEMDRIADSTVTNIFFVAGHVLYTPPAENILPGITQRVVFKLATILGFRVVIEHIMLDELGRFTEAFVCGTAAEIQVVTRIEQHIYARGPVAALIIAAYVELVLKSPAEVDRVLNEGVRAKM
ncbi:putative branched-chain amino acid transferase [Roridomyces roridus]|uniref:Branched-chain amino acid transferase n=1 Tax=Roridomyces roridus TaxID=1738132 RepID=A0AAD7AZS7_9AGAR|nr:putative branched-chain amino acid transferase [Roridomyces roridus]